MKKGVVKFFNESKGFGFITDTEGKDCFVHVTALDGQELQEGDEVSFEVQETPKGPNAVNVQRL
ncbi:MAG: cold-shock protein [Bacteroidota bacterium]